MIKYFKAMPSLTRYIVFSFVMILTYTVIEFIVASNTGNEHSTLTTCFFAVWGGEVLAAALIKVFKLKEENKNEQQFFDGGTCDCIGFDVPDGGSSEEDFE
jgi:hypothetical protein